MKFALVLVAIFGVACAMPAQNTYSLKNDLDDFLALIPTEDIKALYHKYENDADIKKVVAYLKSEDFGKVMHIVANVPEVQDLINWIEDHGVPIIEFLNKLADRLGLPNWPGSFKGHMIVKDTRAWRDFINEVKALLPLDDIISLAIDKLANSPDFQALYEKIASVDYKKLHENAMKHPEIVDMINRLKAMGVDIQKIVDFIKNIFGWSYKTRNFSTFSLKDDLDEFLALIPTEDIKALYHKYENDADIKKVVAYLKSEDFGKVMHIVANVPEVQDLINWIEDHGVPIIDFLNKLADRLGLPNWPGSFKGHMIVKDTRAWRDFINEVKALLPLDDIISLAIDKLANSPDFQALYEKIASVDYKKLHENAMKHPEIVDMINRLKSMGVDIQKIVDFIKNIFGWSYKTRNFSTFSLKDDLDEFLALIPTEDIKALYHKYENDADIKKVVAYLKSEDFGKVMHIVANVPEVQDLVNWIKDHGVPITEFLNKLADRLGLPHWPGSFKGQMVVKDTRAWRDFINEVKALLPLDDIISLAIDKLANSPDFQALYEKIASVDYKKLHENAMKHPEIVDMINRLKAMGVDIQKIVDFIKNIFGWSYKTRNFSTFSLKDDLNDFLALIPTEDIKALYHKYENDADIKKVVAYLKSEDFGKVMHIVANVPEVQDLINWIEDHGVPIIDFLNKLADRLGLPNWPGSFKGHMIVKDTRAWRDFINEVRALLPLDDIISLAIDKLANSPDFQALYEKIASVDYKKLHENAMKHPEIVDMINRLKAMGVDIQKIVDFIKNIFGWSYKTRNFSTFSLKDDLDEFLALIPTEDIKALYHKYENDADIKKVVAYLKSEDFGKVMHIVANVPEVQDLINWIEDHGVPIIEFLNKLADRLGLPNWPGSFKGHMIAKDTRAWRDFINEVKALLPLDDIISLAIDKLANSPDFQALYEKIASVDYKKLHENAMKHPEIVDMINRLKAMGVDIQKIVDFIKNIFGWSYGTRNFSTFSLKDDLDEFLALIPTEDIKALYHKYENDADIKKVVAYLKSEDFGKVMHIVANVPEVQDLVNWIKDHGVPITEFLNKLADRLGLPHWPGSFKGQMIVKDTRAWRDFINEVKALLPLDDIISLAIDKLANSPDFQALYEKIASVDYKKLHENAMKHPEIVDMINRLKAMGVDIQKIVDFIKNIFGWSYGTRNFSTFSLKDDLNDFLALIPTEDIKALYHKYENDADIKKVVAYLKSEDFGKVMHIVANVPEVQDLINWIEDHGVPIIDFLNKLADRLGLPNWPGSFKGQMIVKDTRAWRDFINEVKALLPLDDIISLAIDKLANSPDFQALYEKIASVDYKKLHENAMKHPEIVDMINRLKAMGVDIQKIVDFIKNIFGWTY